jgi:hypothetical protein
MARLYADENFPLPVVEELRRLGHDVLTIQEDGKSNQRVPDHAVLSAAAALDRAILTTNRRHFILLHLASTDHAGIIACTYDPDFRRQAARISDALLLNMPLAGQLIRVNRPGN